MALVRFRALETVQNRKPIAVQKPSHLVSEFFGSNVFTLDKMRHSLSSDMFDRFTTAVDRGEKIDKEVADAVAAAMKSWALSKGATHYTHWFQPLTGATAEKHDSFFDLSSQGTALEKFKGSALVQQEPDASSFPSGGLRNTFEARGYTAWDPTSPAFVIESDATSTLCIPSVFVSYTGEALDYKTPLLKSLIAIDKAATSVCQLFDKNVVKVHPTLGPEQEYFLVDRALFNARPDLIMTGRTVFGMAAAKGQQLEDHYFGSIPERVMNFMVDFETECHKLGIPIRTRHNEVAPGQFECAPTFEEINLAVDHNQLLMDIIDRVALKHNLKALLHEKPFAGVNGSGKHNNWSLSTNTGVNLLAPSSKPKENLQFLTFFICTIRAVFEHADLLRASIASASNDHRLGANEAPPAIMSVFIGSTLTRILDELEKNAKVNIDKGDNMYLKLGINKIPQILLDNTDRNRTSPFAFTGNKFEFRAVGSSANNSPALTVLNTIVADQLNDFKTKVDKIANKGQKRELAIIDVLRQYTKESKAIRFEGNGYSEEWKQEAAKRGLKNIESTPHALEAYISKKTEDLFHRHQIFSTSELHARYEIRLENYVKKIQIEGRIIEQLVTNQVIPTAVKYQNKLIENVKGMKEIGLDLPEFTAVKETILEIAKHIEQVKNLSHTMVVARKKANNAENTEKSAVIYCDEVKVHFDSIRYHVNKLELLVDDEEWPLVKYRELLFLK